MKKVVIIERGCTRVKPTYTKSGKIIITVGCDPEFEEVYDNKAWYTPSVVDPDRSKKIGRDGKAIELRPNHAKSAKTLVKNIRDLIKKCPTISTGGEELCLGGHIHFGGIRPTNAILTALDCFIGGRTNRLASGPRSNQKCSYGVLSSYRGEPHGFEYRVPSSAIFNNPKIAHITLKLAKGIVHRCVNSVLKYSSPLPTRADYRKILTKEEHDYFEQFLKNYKASNTPINKDWA